VSGCVAMDGRAETMPGPEGREKTDYWGTVPHWDGGSDEEMTAASGLRTKDKVRMRSIGGRVLLMKPIRLRKRRVGTENTYQFPSIDKGTKSKGVGPSFTRLLSREAEGSFTNVGFSMRAMRRRGPNGCSHCWGPRARGARASRCHQRYLKFRSARG
jgi:hypothetical protein